jgi:hypothetical protein
MQTPEPPKPTTQSIEITVHICPTEGCGNYFGSSSTPHDLTGELRMGRPEDRTKEGRRLIKGTRSDCPICTVRLGKRVERVPITTRVIVPIATGDEEPVAVPAG